LLAPVPGGATRAIDDRLVDALAGLCRHARITKRPRPDEGGNFSIRFVDDQRPMPRGRADRLLERVLSRNGLFDIEDGAGKARKPVAAGETVEETGKARLVGILLVAVERDDIRLANRV